MTKKQWSLSSRSKNHKLAAQSQLCQQMCFIWLEDGFVIFFFKHVASILKSGFRIKSWILVSPERKKIRKC